MIVTLVFFSSTFSNVFIDSEILRFLSRPSRKYSRERVEKNFRNMPSIHFFFQGGGSDYSSIMTSYNNITGVIHHALVIF